MARKKKRSYAQKIIPLIIIAIVSYTIAAFALQFCTSVEISPTLTTVYFGFWTVEIINLAQIKKSKVKNNKDISKLESED